MATVLTVRLEFEIDDTLTDPTAVVLSDVNGSYGIRATGGANVIAADTDISGGKISTGIYEYEFTEANGAAYDTAYTSYIKATYDDVDYYFDKDHAAVTDPTGATYGYTYYQLLAMIGDFLEYGRNTEGEGSDWSTTEEKRLIECVRQGYWRFVHSPILPGEKTAHRWSFLNPERAWSTVASDYLYDLPADFGSPAGNGAMFYDNAENIDLVITQVSPGLIDRRLAINNAEGRPTQYAIRAKAHDQTAEQVQELMLYPIPDAAYDLLQPYHARFTELSATNLYPLGGQAHRDTLLQSCRAYAAQCYKENPAMAEFEHRMYQERLYASIDFDNRNAPTFLGYNDVGSKRVVTRHGSDFTCSLTNNLG